VSTTLNPGKNFSPWAAAIFSAVLATVGAVGIGGWLVVALIHLSDRYAVGHVQGVWMALTRYASEGTLYPPLSDGVRFGGTRWMPLAILVNAWAARVTGEYLLSGKAVAIILFAVLLLLVFIVLRQLRCGWPLALALTAVLPATEVGALAGSVVGGDLLPVVFQVGSLLTASVALRYEGVGLMLGSGALAGFAACSKLTGVWAALAVLSWLGFQQDWRRIGWFAAACAVSAALTSGLVQWASHGRFLLNLTTLAFAGTAGPADLVRAPIRLMLTGITHAAAVWMVVPFALLGVYATRISSAVTPYSHALGWSFLLTVAVFADRGVGSNHLLDLSVLVIVVAGYLAPCLSPGGLGGVTVTTALALGVIWAGATGIARIAPELRDAITTVRTGPMPQYKPRPLDEIVAPGDTLLSEDPGIPILLGQAPVVLDPFMLRRFDEVQPHSVDALIARIDRAEFDYVATISELSGNDLWWQLHFGPRVVTALRAAYVFMGRIDGYYVYQRRQSVTSPRD
jgi:hypothetical protein